VHAPFEVHENGCVNGAAAKSDELMRHDHAAGQDAISCRGSSFLVGPENKMAGTTPGHFALRMRIGVYVC
jgi:hypothetical protein